MPAAKGPDNVMDDSHSLVRIFNNYSNQGHVPLTELKTNPFRFEEAAAKADGNSDAALKAAKAAELEARKKRMEQARADLAKLKLQTILNGPVRKQAMINATVVKIGDEVNTFKIVDIQSQRVLVSRDGETFTLELGF